jgi:hypothetical protein
VTARMRLSIIIWAALVSIAGILCIYQATEIILLNRDIRKLEETIEQYQWQESAERDLPKELAQLQAQLREQRGRFFRTGDLDLANFGLLVKEALSEMGVETESYRIIETNGRSFLDFTAVGDIFGFVRFIKSVYQAQKYCTIGYLSLTSIEGQSTVRATFRIAHEVLDAVENENSVDVPLSSLFSITNAPLEVEEKSIAKPFLWYFEAPTAISSKESTALAEPKVEAQPLDWLSYIGFVIQDEKTYHIFKDERTNGILRLAEGGGSQDGWQYIGNTEKAHLLERDEQVYLVEEAR